MVKLHNLATQLAHSKPAVQEVSAKVGLLACSLHALDQATKALMTRKAGNYGDMEKLRLWKTFSKAQTVKRSRQPRLPTLRN